MRALQRVALLAARLVARPAVVSVLLGLSIVGCTRPPGAPLAGAIAGDFQPLTARPVEFSFPHKGNDLSVQVLLEADPPGSVAFNVYTDQQWRELRVGVDPVTPLGSGAPGSQGPAILEWQGSSPQAGLYYVQVFRVTQPAAFRIAVSGPGAGGSLPTALPGQGAGAAPLSPAATASELAVAAAPTPTPTRARAAATTARPVAARPTITAPAPAALPRLALTGRGNLNRLGEQAMEFDFQYPGGGLPVELVLRANPPGSAGFNVYTDQQWRLFAGGDLRITPTGRGTPSSLESGALAWQGNSPSPELYHVYVYPVGQPAAFWIALEGPGATSLVPMSPALP